MEGAAQTLQAVNWTLQRLDQLGLVERETYSEYQSDSLKSDNLTGVRCELAGLAGVLI